MKLAQANVARLKLPEGKSDHLEFDDEIPGLASGCALAVSARG
jgi:hypothetical protein